MLKIKEEFKKLIPALTKEEFKQLEDNCMAEGIREKILTWNGFIIDGHNRYEISQKWDLDFETENKHFDSEDDVYLWMIDNQNGRRNLTDGWKYKLQQTKKEILAKKGKDKKVEAGKKYGEGHKKNEEVLSTIDKSSHNTRKEIAKTLNWSTGKVAMADIVFKKASPEVEEKVLNNEITINQAYKEIKKEENKVVLENKKKQNALNLSIEVSENKPDVYHLDCNTFLNTLEDNSVDLLITDPPYSTDVDDINEFSKSWVNLALSKIKPDGRGYICIGGYPKEINAYLNILLKQDKFIVDNPLIWTYKNTLGITPKMKYNLNYQVILHLYSENSRELDTSITSEMWNVMEINAPDGRIGNRYHTWQKPDELAMRLIKHSTKENDLVVDCFACTGTFLLMGSKLNRKTIGCDIDIDNLKIAKERGCTIIGK